MNGRGLGLEAWASLPIGATVVLSIGQVGRQARLGCRVVWCRLVRTEATQAGAVIPIYRIGLEFLVIDER